MDYLRQLQIFIIDINKFSVSGDYIKVERIRIEFSKQVFSFIMTTPVNSINQGQHEFIQVV